MSNSRLRKALEEKELLEKSKKKANLTYERYKCKEDLLICYQMVRAYYNDSGASIGNLIERILKEKYNQPWQEKIIKRAVYHGNWKRDDIINIPQFNFKEKVYDILSKFVKKNFNKMVGDITRQKTGTLYPFYFRDVIEKYS